VRTKCAQKTRVVLWGTIYDPRELPGVSTTSLGIKRGVTIGADPHSTLEGRAPIELLINTRYMPVRCYRINISSYIYQLSMKI
jgi:hypothetical protein